ncbi:MAG: MFS transporter, partial [Ignavibacteria bacterium]|nr:MFS transporter [Ignavibacteria bacterium]
MEPWRKNLYILWGTQFLAMVGMNLVVPFLPFYIRSLGVTDPGELARWSGFAFSGTFLSAFIATPVWGILGDRHGRKIMVVRAIFGLGISQLLIGLAQNVEQVVMFRILQGAISGFIASSLALVSTNTPRERIGYALGLLQSSTAAGMVLGPFFGGLLADLIGFREIFFITASLCTVGGFLVLFHVKEVKRTSPKAKVYTIRDNYRLMYSDKRLRIVGIALVAGQMSVLMIEPIFALFIEGFHSDSKYLSTLTGAVFSIAGLFMVIAGPWWGKRNDRTGFRNTLPIAFALTGLAYAGHLVVANLIQLGALRALLGFARGGVLPTLYSLTSHYAPPERRGGIIAIASSLTLFGNMLGPIVGGYAAEHFGIAGSFMVNSVLLLATGILVWRFLAPDEPDSPASVHEP